MEPAKTVLYAGRHSQNQTTIQSQAYNPNPNPNPRLAHPSRALILTLTLRLIPSLIEGPACTLALTLTGLSKDRDGGYVITSDPDSLQD